MGQALFDKGLPPPRDGFEVLDKGKGARKVLQKVPVDPSFKQGHKIGWGEFDGCLKGIITVPACQKQASQKDFAKTLGGSAPPGNIVG